LPHLKQIGIEVVFQDALPKWDRTFGDLYAQVEQARARTRREDKPMARSRKPAQRASKTTGRAEGRLYIVEAFLLSGPITAKFAKKNPVVSRTIQLRGDQTLADLHHAIFDAYGRWENTCTSSSSARGQWTRKLGDTCCPTPWKSKRSSPTRPSVVSMKP